MGQVMPDPNPNPKVPLEVYPKPHPNPTHTTNKMFVENRNQTDFTRNWKGEKNNPFVLYN